jgi:hypothetical protein
VYNCQCFSVETIITAYLLILAMNQPPVRLNEPTDADVAAYHSLSGWAVAGLIAGAISILALVDPWLWTIPIAAIYICCRALWKIHQNAPILLGRKLALAGLWLSVFSIAAASGDWFYYRQRVGDEARQTALFWFDLIARNRPEAAFQLTLVPQQRHALDEQLWDFYKNSEKMRTELENYVAPPKPEEPPRLVRTLLALGDAAKTRYFKTIAQVSDGPFYVIDQLYAVTFDDAGEKKTFFVMVRLGRMTMSNGRASWRILGAEGGFDQYGNQKTNPEDNPI